MKINKVVCFLLVVVVSIIMTSCSSQEVEKLTKIEPITLLSSTTTKLSQSEKEDIVYQQVSDRHLLDLDKLSKVSSTDSRAISDYIERVDKVLQGGSDATISDDLVNYLLYEFYKTPYEWERSGTKVLGVDTESRRFVVDVNYRTTSNLKTVIPASNICLGEPDYEVKLKLRYERYMEILKLKDDQKSGFSNPTSAAELAAKIQKFESAYGSIPSLLEAQKELSTVSKMRDDWKTGKIKTPKHFGYTYSGLINNQYEKTGASMTVRFVIKYNYNLGVKVGTICERAYVLSYNLFSDPTTDWKATDKVGSDLVNKSAEDLIYRYYRCVEEDNHIGLYSLMNGYTNLDKFYEDMFNYSYRKYQGFTTTLYDVDGRAITLGVNVVRKVRGKGTNMTFPTYEEKYLYNLSLVGNKLKIMDEVLISSKLIGEPVINNSGSVDQTGGLLSGELNASDKDLVTKVVNEFSQLQVNEDTSSDNFRKVIDISLSSEDLAQLKSNMLSVKADKKSTWISSWLYGSKMYAQLKLVEVFNGTDSTVYNCESEIDLMKRDGTWYVIKYSHNSVVPISATGVDYSNATSTVQKNK